MTELIASERKRYELVSRQVDVVRVSKPVPNLVRVTLGGKELKGFLSGSPSDHIKVFFPPEDAMRDYTPLEFRDGVQPELDVDIVLHEGLTGDSGPASLWATTAKSGDSLRIAGPRGSYIAPAGITGVVLVGDESALPAISRWLLKFADLPVTVLAMAPEASWEKYLADSLSPNHEVQWFTGVDREKLREKALRALSFTPTIFVYLAGEANGIVPLRRFLRRELNLSPVQVKAEGFWRRGVADFDHHEPLDPNDP